MFRLKMENSRGQVQYKWYQDAKTAHTVAYIIVKNKDFDVVTVENLKEKKVEKIYKRA